MALLTKDAFSRFIERQGHLMELRAVSRSYNVKLVVCDACTLDEILNLSGHDGAPADDIGSSGELGQVQAYAWLRRA